MSDQTVELNLNKHKKKMAAEDIVFYVFNTIIMLLFAIVTLYPVLNTLAYSFNEGNDAVRGGIHLLPRAPTLRNYQVSMSSAAFWASASSLRRERSASMEALSASVPGRAAP